jgi:CTP synthase (UTP-ammonia lyase)
MLVTPRVVPSAQRRKMNTPVIALVGDYSPAITAHRAIPIALQRARDALGAAIGWEWVHTREIAEDGRTLSRFAGIWVVPGSPYTHMAGALAAIRFARESQRPFLGTCGGFQHALIEIARNVAGLACADHAETNPMGNTLIVTTLGCSLVEQVRSVRFVQGSRLAFIYGAATSEEGYHCNYGPNPEFRSGLEQAGMRFTAFDDSGEIRGGELATPEHPFFVGTLFQPERAALRGELPPLVHAFVAAVIAAASNTRETFSS